jgi:hypothetical protein
MMQTVRVTTFSLSAFRQIPAQNPRLTAWSIDRQHEERRAKERERRLQANTILPAAAMSRGIKSSDNNNVPRTPTWKFSVHTISRLRTNRL